MPLFVSMMRVRYLLALVLLLSASDGVAAHAPWVRNLTAADLIQSTSTPGPDHQSEAQVVMKAVKFQPPELSVHGGQTVEFKNEDIFAHTVTADDGSFDSGLIQPGQSWKLAVPKTGPITYHCRPHPNMKGQLVLASESPAQDSGAHGGVPGFNPPRRPQELHPILVNFTAALLPLALLSDVFGRLIKRESLHHTASWLVLYAALITPLTAAAGWWWKGQSAGTLPANVIAAHQWLGSILAVLFIVLAVWRWRIQRTKLTPGVPYLLFATIVVLALIYQGSLGGLMVFGR